MAIFTIGGREVVAELLLNQTFYLALGSGDPNWDIAIEPPSPTATDLIDKFGLTRMRRFTYVVPNLDGEIQMADSSKFAASDAPSRYLYIAFRLDPSDAKGELIREAGLYWGTKLVEGTPAGQMYLEKQAVVSWGKLIHLDRFNSIERDGLIEQTFSFVLTL
jgi:hypothetical protein